MSAAGWSVVASFSRFLTFADTAMRRREANWMSPC